MYRRWGLLLLLAVFTAIVGSADARVLRVEVESRTPVLGGKSFGSHGAYELVRGTIVFAVDPAHPRNQAIVDLSRAPRDSLGRVRARANIVVLQPVDPEKRQGIGLVEVSNRGGKFSLPYFNRATAALDPDDPAAFGDGLLMEKGITMIWVGWQWDVPREGNPLRLKVPVARASDGSPIGGTVRSDWVVDDSTHVLPLAHRDHVPYPVADFDHSANVLTVRADRDAPRRVIPRDEWRFARVTDEGTVVPDSAHVYRPEGFAPGKIYEAVYWAEDPRVVGLGLAAIRDVISYAKYDPNAVFPVDEGLAVGVSQTGRFLRHFLYQGFNVDEDGRRAYDGLMIVTAGAGRGSFNHRFAQPSRDAHRFSAFQYPTDLFPFTGRTQMDSVAWRSDGLLARTTPAHRPKTFYVNTGYEYWGRAASLIHTTPDGTRDVAPLPNERIYHLASAQHFPWRFPPPEENKLRSRPTLYRGNPLDQSVNYRALLVELVNWVEEDTAPPSSVYPRHADGTLVSPDALAFPEIPGVQAPAVIHEAYRMDYGPRWRQTGILRHQPPRIGPAYPSLVSQVDSLGNERAGVQNVGVRVPLATYTPWNLRLDAPRNRDELTDFYGSIVPLPRTPEEKARTNDPRPAVTTLYDGRQDYLKQVAKAADTLIARGFLLSADRQRVLDRAQRLWAWIMADDRSAPDNATEAN
jgi:hypothetical protein